MLFEACSVGLHASVNKWQTQSQRAEPLMWEGLV